MCAAFRPLYVTEEQANKCEYPVSGSVRFQPEQINAVTDSVPEQRRPDHTITINDSKRQQINVTYTVYYYENILLYCRPARWQSAATTTTTTPHNHYY